MPGLQLHGCQLQVLVLLLRQQSELCQMTQQLQLLQLTEPCQL